MLQHLVGAVGGPDAVDVEAVPEVVGQGTAERGELPVGVPVEREDRGGDAGDDVVRDVFGDRMRVLVDVEGDREGLLRGTVWRAAAQVVADGQVVEARHQSMLATARRPPRGRDVTGRPGARAGGGGDRNQRGLRPVLAGDFVAEQDGG